MSTHKRERIGIVEDDLCMGGTLAHRLELEGYTALWWKTGQEALEGLLTTRPGLVVCDIVLPDMSGEDIFLRALPQLGGVPFLFVTAHAQVADAVRLMKSGAVDYLTKPYAISALLERIDQLIKLQPRASGDLGTSEAMRRVELLVRRVANIDSLLLFTGESGVGKEVAARFVHQISARASEPFIPVNCGAIPDGLIEMPRENLVRLPEFEFDRLGRQFEFALAHSLFTHLTFNSIRRCLEQLAPVINIGGHFFATFFELPRTASASLPYTHEPGEIVTYDTCDPYHYRLADFFYAASGLPWQIRYIGTWEHPRGQRMLEFVRT